MIMTMMRDTFFLIFGLLFVNTLSGQVKPEIEFGAIAWASYLDSGPDNSPLQRNDGDATFISDVSLFLGVDINEHVSFYSEVQSHNGFDFIVYGLSAIYRPEASGLFNLEFGKFLAPFGTFLSRKWPSENPLMNWPLLYDYRTALSASDLAQNESELLLVRGRGYGFQYGETGFEQSSGNSTTATSGKGVRLLSRQVYLTGFQVFGSSRRFSYHFGATNGSLSNPANINNTTGVQLLGRATYSPTFGLELGSSFAWGGYLDKSSVESQLETVDKSAQDFRQTALGFDLSYSFGHLIFFSELLLNRWESPFIDEDLDVVAFDLEIKYRFLTRFYLAGRFSRIDFKNIDDPEDVDGDGFLRESWDYDVDQLEVGVGYHFNRNALLKVFHVFNTTHDIRGGDPSDDQFTTQLVVSF